MTTPTGEVRKCHRCGEAAVVQVFAWDLSYGQQELELRCQRCGTLTVVKPKAVITGLWIGGALATFATCGLMFPFLLYARWRSKALDRVPVVPGAPFPAIRFPGGPPRRLCGTCGTPARLVKVVRNTSKGIPTGTESEFTCDTCKVEFTIESIWGHVFSTFAGLIIAAIAVAFFTQAESPGWKYGGGLVSAGLTLFVYVQSALRIRNRFKHPLAPVALEARWEGQP